MGGFPPRYFIANLFDLRVPKLTFGQTIPACGLEEREIDRFHNSPLSCWVGSIFRIGITEKSRTQTQASLKLGQSGVFINQVQGWRNVIYLGRTTVFIWG